MAIRSTYSAARFSGFITASRVSFIPRMIPWNSRSIFSTLPRVSSLPSLAASIRWFVSASREWIALLMDRAISILKAMPMRRAIMPKIIEVQLTLEAPVLAALMLAMKTCSSFVTSACTVSVNWLVTGTRVPAILLTSCCSDTLVSGSEALYCLSMAGIKSFVIPLWYVLVTSISFCTSAFLSGGHFSRSCFSISRVLLKSLL